MNGELERQFFNAVPPRRGQGFNQTIDGTARAYDMTVLDWGGTPYKRGHVEQCLFLELHNDASSTSNVFFRFRENSSADLDETVVNGAGTAWSNSTTLSNIGACQELGPGAFARVRVDREVDKYFEVKTPTSGSATLRITLASQTNK